MLVSLVGSGAVLSIFVSGALYRRAEHLSHAIRSPALHTTAHHSKADAECEHGEDDDYSYYS